MNRVQETLKGLILIAATLVATEWVHYRLGEPTMWSLLNPQSSRYALLGPDDSELFSVTEGDFQTYLRVLERMQGDHGLSIEEALAPEHLSLERFRDLEQRVQRNDILVERTRENLRRKAQSLWDSRTAALEQG